MREKRLHLDLLTGIEKVNSDENNKMLLPNQIPDELRRSFQFFHERSDRIVPRNSFLLNRISTIWNIIPK